MMINTERSNIEALTTVTATPQQLGRLAVPYGQLTSPAQLLDHRVVQWDGIVRAHYWLEQSFEYSYPGPIRDLRQQLKVVPPDTYGDQRVRAYALHIASSQSLPLEKTVEETDSFGNRLFRIAMPQVDERVRFAVKSVIERVFAAESAESVVRIKEAEASRYGSATHLTTADSQIKAHAARLRAEYTTPESFGNALNSWLYATMRYGRGATTVHTTAAEALQIGQGLCQDYAHIMLAVCRAAGLAARYVSGHLLGEGRSHAWVELFIPDSRGGYRAMALDPTNHRHITPAYLTVAVGRDYSDVSPATGTFTAPYHSHLDTTKRAGIIQLDRAE